MSSHHTCRMCASPLAIDQRYCVQCGTRVRPVPRWAAGSLGLLFTDSAEPAPAIAARKERPVKFGPFVVPWSAPSPRAAAVSILAVLSFGVAVGAAGLSDGAGILEVMLGEPAAAATSPAQQQLASAAQPANSSAPGSASQVSGSPSTSPTPTTATATSTPSSTGTTPTGTTPTPGTLPQIKYVWVITLGDAGYSQTFAPASSDTYLSQTLVEKGELLPTYYATGTSDLANEVALISGQGPTNQIDSNCPTYNALKPGKVSKVANQVLGDGCVFANQTETLFGQLQKAHYSWKTYVQGLSMAVAPTLTTPSPTSTTTTTSTSTTTTVTTSTTTTSPTTTTTSTPVTTATTEPLASNAQLETLIGRFDPAAARAATHAHPRHHATHRRARLQTTNAATCRHPNLGATDTYANATKRNGYVTWRNPAVYFDSITSTSSCASGDVGLNTLADDLEKVKSTPNVSFIYPDACDGGSATACVTNAADGTAPADKFLKSVVPEIMASPAYKSGNGLILITFAEAPQSGPNASQASYNDPAYPNLPTTSTTSTTSTSTTGTDTTTTGTETDITSTTGTETDITATTGTDTSTTGTDTTGTDTTGTDTTTTGTTGTGTSTTGTSTTPTGFCSAAIPTDINGNPCTGGGGQTGLLAISKCMKPATTDAIDTGANNFILLASLEELFGLKYLGYAGAAKLMPLSAGFYNNYSSETGLCNASSLTTG